MLGSLAGYPLMSAVQSISSGFGRHGFAMMPYRTIRFPGTKEAQAQPAAMDTRYAYRHVNSPLPVTPQFTTHSAVLGLRMFTDRGHPLLAYARWQVNSGVGPFKPNLDVYV
mgnify:CR=1 FL=1